MAMHDTIEGRGTLKGTRDYVGFWQHGGEHDASHLGRLRKAYMDALVIGEQLHADRERIQGDKNLTDIGKRDALAKSCARHAAALKRGRLAIEGAERGIAEQKEALRPKPADKTDVAGALRRQELRAWLRGLSVDERAEALKQPNAEIVQAVVEMPAPVSGTNQAYYERMVAAAIENGNPGALDELAKLESALETAKQAVGVAAAHVRDTAGVLTSAFDAWVEDHAGKVGVARPVVGIRDGQRVRFTQGKSELTGATTYGAPLATAEEWEIGYHFDPSKETLTEAFAKVA